MKIALSLLLLTVLASDSTAQSLSSTDKKITASVDAALPATLELLKESVNINSGTFNLEGVKQTGALYAKALSALGFTIEWIPEPDSLRRAGHLVAYRTGN